VLAGADVVHGDGTGVRWAVRWLHGVPLVDNVNGTDLVPALFRTRAGRGYRYYLLGGTPEMAAGAAAHARATFAGWELVGHHHGYLDPASNAAVLAEIEHTRPHLVLVGMGNPHQERWIDANRARVAARVCLGVGGIFAYWSGDLDRAAPWVRGIGFEWLHLLRRQPRKARRYLVGNPLFLARVWAARRARRTASVP
jgi:N-acetylglucosaminyldiphosphoundecaprenol N-acetyl-beta-D-mannosaminyltransferase